MGHTGQLATDLEAPSFIRMAQQHNHKKSFLACFAMLLEHYSLGDFLSKLCILPPVALVSYLPAAFWSHVTKVGR